MYQANHSAVFTYFQFDSRFYFSWGFYCAAKYDKEQKS
ncbi:hypothetical protein RUM_15510 [Ruminococcus champanellensis 18P13 = JCM 17042]|uniref:Uncharacterized protein n=1 Tax=Ruminococcus champanellensis (strain DSM 18848 / JCM 17042 / KCTC 15320 / 18P13) TaxID=213810 RepID=D4LDE9_RUMC1|nr:hypothetical protein RUM_15510 [Ruminococcus champanellensis 18P13 = JCM 17042]